jgi:hypothetical protein
MVDGMSRLKEEFLIIIEEWRSMAAWGNNRFTRGGTALEIKTILVFR